MNKIIKKLTVISNMKRKIVMMENIAKKQKWVLIINNNSKKMIIFRYCNIQHRIQIKIKVWMIAYLRRITI